MAAPAPPDPAALVGARLGNYRLVRLLGRGRMGAVYLADDTALLRPTAVKVLSWLSPAAPGQDPVEWFLSEARLVARINHPRVVQIYGAAQAGEHFYIAMEYVPGQSAEALLEQGPLAAPRAAALVAQVAAALHAAHRVGVVHRDVKPANILLDHEGQAKLGDFGMALTASAARASTNVRAGTPYYTAPEIWQGSAATPAADLYSLGATWFHLLTGSPPFPGADREAVVRGHLSGAIPDPRDRVATVPEGCARLIRRLLAKTPKERHSSAQVLFWDLRRLERELALAGSGARPAGPPARRREPVPPSPATDERGRSPAGALEQALGLAGRPFVEPDPARPPFRGEPLAAVLAKLEAWAREGDAPLLALTGAAGSGRTTLALQLGARLSAERLVLRAGLAGRGAGTSPLEQLCSAAGAPIQDGDPRSGDRLDGLLESLELERRQGRPPPLVILDGASLPLPAEGEVASLIGAAAWVGSFRLLVIGAPGLAAALAASGIDLHGEAVAELAVPALSPAQVGAYVRAWLAARLAPGAPPLLISPDAVLLLARRSEGLLSRIDLLAENMLMLAAREGTRVVSSWHAWAASTTERWARRERIAPLPRRRAGAPPPGFLEALDACRRAAGLGPYPRQNGAGMERRIAAADDE